MSPTISEDTPVRYIKLGSGGMYAKECFEENYARIGFDDDPHEVCKEGRWGELGNGGKITALKRFYEDDSETVWITFHRGMMYWTQLEENVVKPDHLDKYRKVRHCVDGWSNESLNGTPLEEYRISGKLLQVKSYQGTICEPSGSDVALQLINDRLSESVKRLQDALGQTRDAAAETIGELKPGDLELLVDLVFRESGLQRRHQLGGTRENVDLELVEPISDEVAYAQVKAKSFLHDYEGFVDAVKSPDDYQGEQYYFITTNPDEELRTAEEQYVETEEQSIPVRLITEDRLADWVVDVGLTHWLTDRASSNPEG